jgi:hypothetical protein
LARRIKAFWAAAGFDIRVEVIHAARGGGESPIFGIRSNLKSGLPPQGGANNHA